MTAPLTTLLAGKSVRPSGSDYPAYWPPPGTWVSWTVVRGIQDLLDQGKKYGWLNLGTIGNLEHLKRHGDHTPWSAGKKVGRIYAKDTKTPSDFRAWLVARCKNPLIDTRFIDFFNIDNMQFDYAGNYLGYSGDTHWHISIQLGYENARVTLIDAYYADKNPPQEDEVTPEDIKAIAAAVVNAPVPVPGNIPAYMGSYVPSLGYVLHSSLYNLVTFVKNEVAEDAEERAFNSGLKAAFDALVAKLEAGGGSVDAAAIISAVREEAVATRVNVEARADVQLDRIAEAFNAAAQDQE